MKLKIINIYQLVNAFGLFVRNRYQIIRALNISAIYRQLPIVFSVISLNRPMTTPILFLAIISFFKKDKDP